jgi:nitrite reductase/ring-hydroxylating ferredoxin subunit
MLLALGEAGGRTAWTIEAPDGRAFAVFVVDGEHHVTDARCPHNKGPLVEGTIRDSTTLVCPWHSFRFDLRSGACANHHLYDLRVYPVLERDGALHAEVGEAPAARSASQRVRTDGHEQT